MYVSQQARGQATFKEPTTSISRASPSYRSCAHGGRAHNRQFAGGSVLCETTTHGCYSYSSAAVETGASSADIEGMVKGVVRACVLEHALGGPG